MASDGKRVVIESKAELRRWFTELGSGAMRPREVPAKELAAVQKAFRSVNAETERLMRAPVMIGFDPASPGGDRSCLSIQSANLGTPDMVIVNGRRYVPAEGRDG